MSNWIEASAVPRLLGPGSCVYVGGSANEPTALVDAIIAAPISAREVRFIQQPLPVNTQDFSALHETASQETYFATPALKGGLASGRVRFVPMQMRAIFDHIASSKIDVALLGAARDLDGVIRYGPNVDYVEAALTAAKTVIVEVSNAYVASAGAPTVDASSVKLVASDSPRTHFPLTEPDALSKQIGNHIAALIRDGDCLQTGIGAVPAAILAGLTDKNDLGFHGGLIDDGVVTLARNGNLTSAAKPIDTGLHISGMALGTAEMHAWLETAREFVFRGANYTHEVGVIRQIPQFVSINSAVEVDLMGQINAEVVGGRQISGTGGSVDFMRASKASPGGRSVVAMSATAQRGQSSRIVRRVSVVTALRTDVDLVVTEYGVADLRSASLAERAEQLIAIAHPDFRDELRESL